MKNSDKMKAASQSEADGTSRRDFVKGAAAAGTFGIVGLRSKAVAAELPPELALFPPSVRKRHANDKINLGIVGVGGRGSALLRQVLSMDEECRVVAVCDVYAKRRERAKTMCEERGQSPDAYQYHTDLIDRDDVDAIIVATPDHWHAGVSLEAMRKGKDVYCEKPMTHTIPEAREMAETSVKLGRVVQVGSQTTSADQWWQAKQAISDGMIGKLLLSQGSYHRNSTGGEWNYGIDKNAAPDKTGEDHIDWDWWQKPAAKHYEWNPPRFFRFRKYWAYSGGIATDLFFHVMAPLNLCWPEPEFPWRAVGTGGIYAFDDGREVPDTFMLAADYPSGHSVVLSSSMANSTHIPGLIRGHEGTITMVRHGKFEGHTPYITVEPETIGDVADRFKEKYGSRSVKLDTGSRPSHMQNFFDCIRSREEPVLSARKAYRVQAAITLGVHSYRNGRVMYFDSDKQEMTDKRPANTMGLDKPGVIHGDDVREPDFGIVRGSLKDA